MSQSTSPTRDDAVRARQQEVEGHIDHGHSVAGWAGAGLGLLGSGVASVAVVLALVWLFWVGMVVMLLGLPVGIVLGRAARKKQDSSHDGHSTKGVR